MTDHSKLISEMISYYNGDPKRIQHFLKVHAFARTIGELEALDPDTLFILETAAITHDIGIKISEQKYGSCEGHYQEKEGPAEAEKMLNRLNYDPAIIDRVCWLIAHHHTYTDIDSVDYQILVEADFLVNLYEDNEPDDVIRAAYDKIFRTETGRFFCIQMFRPGTGKSSAGHSALSAASSVTGSASSYVTGSASPESPAVHSSAFSKSQSERSEPPSGTDSNLSETRIPSGGYAVTQKCKGCNNCVDFCPVQCIDGSRKPVYIDQTKCLHCGTCFKICEEDAIYKIL